MRITIPHERKYNVKWQVETVKLELNIADKHDEACKACKIYILINGLLLRGYFDQNHPKTAC